MCFHFADVKTESQKAGAICLRSHTHTARGQSGWSTGLPPPPLLAAAPYRVLTCHSHSASIITPPPPLPPQTQPSTGLPQSPLNQVSLVTLPASYC